MSLIPQAEMTRCSVLQPSTNNPTNVTAFASGCSFRLFCNQKTSNMNAMQINVFLFRAMGDRKSRQVIMLIKIIITCTNTITRLTVASHPQRGFLVAVKISTYKKSHLQNGKQSQFPCQTISFAHVLCRSLYWHHACGSGTRRRRAN
ncbi:Uncharacterised protein [Escherichia coli]|uniref:Uncharacterized protein n=1 Tax=Escherichia coli TaxID=562 RepID=A0A2X3KDZ3_ECOLX|nr:Uncharacterised protein [Escherichia coli]